jgi:hypothetical protein
MPGSSPSPMPPAQQFPPGYAMPPGQMPQAVGPAPVGVSMISQFTGAAGWGILLGLVTIAVPFIFGRVFFFLPIIGLIAGIQAIRTGKLIGGIVAIVLNIIGGIITLIGLFGG